MARTFVIVALLFGLLGPVHALRVIEDVENSVELALGDLTLPADSGGMVTFRACATCPLSMHRVTGETKYILNRRELPLLEFLAAIEDIRSTASIDRRALAGVFFDINTERVTRVIVVARGAQSP